MTSTTKTTKTSTQTKELQTPLHHQQEKGKLNTINPATEEVIKQYEIMVKEQINERIKMARNTFEVWKKDINKRIESDPRVPFGGVKKSGFGRELSRYGMMEFANIKSVRFYDELVDYHHVE